VRQHPGSPWFPQQLERVRTLIQLLRTTSLIFRLKGMGWRRF
jgi:hypothetical protein